MTVDFSWSGDLVAFVFVVGLASARVWRLFALDDITAPLREWLVSSFGWGGGFVDFLECPWCAGFWATVAVFFLAAAGGVFGVGLVALLAAAQVAAWMSLAGMRVSGRHEDRHED